MDEWSAQLWIAVVGAIGGALTVVVGAWRVITRSKVDAAGKREQLALDALLSDANVMRDQVFSRLSAQETRMESLQAQLDAAREVNLELRGKVAELEGAVAAERKLRERAEGRATALSQELHELQRQLQTMR